jgi:hypothetical protein
MTYSENNLAHSIDLGWEPEEMSSSPELAKLVSSDYFRDKIKLMLERYDTLEPKFIEEYGRPYILLDDRLKVFESVFDFGEAWIGTAPINSESDAPIYMGTIYLRTESGRFEPWVQALGQGDPTRKTREGLLADAETSAKRRLLSAIGLGDGSDQELFDDASSGVKQSLINEIENKGWNLSVLLSEYKTNHSRFKLSPLNVEDEKSIAAAARNPDIAKVVESITLETAKNMLSFIKERTMKK